MSSNHDQFINGQQKVLQEFIDGQKKELQKFIEID